MIEIRQILCPVDFSDFSQHALAHAAALARWYGAGLTVQYVYRVSIPPAALAPGMGPVGAEALILAQVDQAQLARSLETFAAVVGVGDLAVRYDVVEGDVAQAILEQAQATKADLIVLGTHGRSGFERLVLGSVTEKIVRKAHGAVLTVPPATDAPTAPALFQRIVAAIDFSEASMRGLTHALSLAQEANATLTLVHVAELPHSDGEWIPGAEDMEGLARKIVASAATKLHAAVPTEAREWCQIDERVETGRPYREIVRVARETHAGLIVLGKHGHSAVDRLFVGSTAQHVVRQAPCPVLTVRA
jgi:nucleotide-binding universal stress UspA family protein